jgi:hypothetical protein
VLDVYVQPQFRQASQYLVKSWDGFPSLYSYPFQFQEPQISNATDSIRDPIQVLIVKYKGYSISGGVNIRLDVSVSQLNGMLECGPGILWPNPDSPSMREGYRAGMIQELKIWFGYGDSLLTI